MKILLIVIALVLLCLIIAGVAVWYLKPSDPGEDVASVDVEADIQAIKDIVADTNVALNTGDIDKVSFYHADEVIVIPPNRPPLIGKDASKSDLQQFFDQFNVQEVDVFKDAHISGDLAVAYYTWSAIVTPKDGGEQRESNGNGIIVLKKQPENVWKIIYSIWSNETLVRPPQSE